VQEQGDEAGDGRDEHGPSSELFGIAEHWSDSFLKTKRRSGSGGLIQGAVRKRRQQENVNVRATFFSCRWRTQADGAKS
jgi:hypothetical protein